MSKHNDEVVCDYINCPFPNRVIKWQDRGQLNFVKSDYHGACFLAENRQKAAAVKGQKEKVA